MSVARYKVWIHIEGLDEDGDCIEGDEYYEPREAGCLDTVEEAEQLRDGLLDMAVPLLTAMGTESRKVVRKNRGEEWNLGS